MRIPVSFALLLATIAPALADGAIDRIITQADRDRLDRYDETRKEGLAEARDQGNALEYKALSDLLERPTVAFGDIDLTGNWQCRTIKAGGVSPLVVYSWFRCRVTDDGSGWVLQKLSGSQRTKGRFYTESDKRLTYLGAGYVNNDRPPQYGMGPKSDQVGYAVATGPREWRIEFPAPTYESKFDILELRR